MNGDLQWDQIDTECPYNIQCRFLTLLLAFFLTLGLLAFIAAVVGAPKIIVAMQRKDISSQDEKIESQQKQIETLLQEIGTLKQERFVIPN